jgi:hypothetical protein
MPASPCGRTTSPRAAGTQEIADLLEEQRSGRPPRGTRSFAEREAPYRALPDDELREALAYRSRRKLAATADLAARGPDAAVMFTGRRFTAGNLQRHGRSEAALHRWDLVGDDAASSERVAQADLTAMP